MKSFIALLRGINVSGQKMIKMSDLKIHLQESGFTSIQTYIQSGNIIFRSDETDTNIIESLIKEKILQKYGFEVPTLVKTPEELIKVINDNPFRNKDLESVYVTFLSQEPSEINIFQIKTFNYSPEELVISAKNIYLHCPDGYGKAKMNNNFIENKLKVPATTRNWKTVNKLLEIAEGIS